jgi:hypothetical protein
MDKAGPNPPPGNDPSQVWDDWWTIWQSELAQLATDRELREVWTTMIALWRSFAPNSGPAGELHDPRAARRAQTRPVGAARAAAAAAAPDAGGDEVVRLRERVADLESRLASLESRPRRRAPRS